MSEDKKICPYCGEEIEADTVKCPHCSENLNEQNKIAELIAETKHIKLTSRQKNWLIKLINTLSIMASIVFALNGASIISGGQIGIADIVAYLTYWVIAIYFLLLWKFTEQKGDNNGR